MRIKRSGSKFERQHTQDKFLLKIGKFVYPTTQKPKKCIHVQHINLEKFCFLYTRLNLNILIWDLLFEALTRRIIKRCLCLILPHNLYMNFDLWLILKTISSRINRVDSPHILRRDKVLDRIKVAHREDPLQVSSSPIKLQDCQCLHNNISIRRDIQHHPQTKVHNKQWVHRTTGHHTLRY